MGSILSSFMRDKGTTTSVKRVTKRIPLSSPRETIFTVIYTDLAEGTGKCPLCPLFITKL